MSATWRASCTRKVLGRDAGPFVGGPDKIVLHSTETGFVIPGYSGGGNAPHETWVWDPAAKRLRLYQHISHDRGAKALLHSGPVQTNLDSAHQVEIAASCDRSFANRYGYLYLPEAPDDFLIELGRAIRQLAADVGVPLTTVGTWQSYPASAGARGGTNAVRMSLSQWDNFTGICGHQHVATNLHGDPGDLPVVRALALSGDDHRVVHNPPVVTPRAPTNGGGGAPRFPLAAGNYFGPKSGPAASHSGYYGAADRAGLRVWQAQVRKTRVSSLGVDGLYGPATANAARTVQRAAGIATDGLIGVRTWTAAFAR